MLSTGPYSARVGRRIEGLCVKAHCNVICIEKIEKVDDKVNVNDKKGKITLTSNEIFLNTSTLFNFFIHTNLPLIHLIGHFIWRKDWIYLFGEKKSKICSESLILI